MLIVISTWMNYYDVHWYMKGRVLDFLPPLGGLQTSLQNGLLRRRRSHLTLSHGYISPHHTCWMYQYSLDETWYYPPPYLKIICWQFASKYWSFFSGKLSDIFFFVETTTPIWNERNKRKRGRECRKNQKTIDSRLLVKTWLQTKFLILQKFLSHAGNKKYDFYFFEKLWLFVRKFSPFHKIPLQNMWTEFFDLCPRTMHLWFGEECNVFPPHLDPILNFSTNDQEDTITNEEISRPTFIDATKSNMFLQVLWCLMKHCINVFNSQFELSKQYFVICCTQKNFDMGCCRQELDILFSCSLMGRTKLLLGHFLNEIKNWAAGPLEMLLMKS